MNEQKTCCICGALLTDRKCMSCGHAQCAECEVFVKQPTIEELQADITTLTAQNVILGMGILDIGETATEQQIRDKAKAIHTKSQAANAPSAVEAEIAKLKAEVARLAAPVSEDYVRYAHLPEPDGFPPLFVRRSDIAARSNPPAPHLRWKTIRKRPPAQPSGPCGHCEHDNPHTSPAGEIADGCNEPGCNCGYYCPAQPSAEKAGE